MVERKLFKTKLCVLYQKGRCSRHSCSFAHGNSELRGFSGSYTDRIGLVGWVVVLSQRRLWYLHGELYHGYNAPTNHQTRRDHHGSDLRNKLGRRHSPSQRFSPVRDTRGRQKLREYSSSMSLERTRKRRKKQHFDGQGDFSGSLRISEGTEDQVKEGKTMSANPRDVLEEQLKKMQSDINVLEHRKLQLGVFLEERVQEADSLTSRIQELEVQLRKEKEECKRITSRMKKFVKAQNRHSRIQDELKRSQVRLQKLGDQLGSDITRNVANEEDSINIVSDGETGGFPVTTPHNELQNDASSGKKGLCVNRDPSKGPKQADLTKVGHLEKTIRSKKLSRWNLQPVQLNEGNEIKAINNGNDSNKSLANEGKHKRGKTVPASILTAYKMKGLESTPVVPPTSMAAHVEDEEVEIELEDRTGVVETATTGIEKGPADEIMGVPFPLPPPPPIRQNSYSLYKGDNENVDVDGLQEEIVNVDTI